MSSRALLEELAANLQNDGELNTWCAQTWGRPLTVKVSYRNRAEIGADELPLLMLTSPSNSRSRNYGSVDQERTVRIYGGFYQPDQQVGGVELYDFEEAVCAAIERMSQIGGFGELKDPLTSVNDEGSFQPNYFFAGEFTVTVS